MKTPPDQSAGATGTTDPQTAKSATEDLARQADSAARDLGETVAQDARDRAEDAREGVAEDISSVSQALRRASDDLRDGSPQERSFGAAANALADLAETVRDKDLGQMVDELGDFARRNPMAFLGGAALLGFAGVRMAKASQRARLADDADATRPSYRGDPARGATGAGPVTATGTNRGDPARGATGAAPVTATGTNRGDTPAHLQQTGETP
ncbi:MAG: hypothetical protein EP318_03200 [Rhodobacteraceae bacterium]|nr:MAG: hypothetical protein EP318_03200 [Paracoccaceae bacterium]